MISRRASCRRIFLILQRAHGGQRLESVVQRRIAEVGQTCQLVDAQRLGIYIRRGRQLNAIC